MENKDKNNIYYRLLLIAAIIIPVIIGFSYAYFLAVVQGTEDPTTIQGTVVNDLLFDLQTENNGYINATGIFPLNQDEVDTNASRGTFTVVSGNNAYGVTYTLSLTDISLPTELKNQYFKWRLICTSCADTSKNAEGTFANATTETNLKTDIFIPPNSSDTYNLLIWLDNASNVDQTSTMNKTFSAKVQATAEFATSRVPSTYQEVEYIESTGTQYIDIGLIANQDTGFEIDFIPYNSLTTGWDGTTSTPGTIFGSRLDSIRNGYQLTTWTNNSKKGHFLFGTDTSNVDNIRYDAQMASNIRQHILFKNLILSNNGNNINVTLYNFETPSTLLLFALNGENGVKENSIIRLYSFKLYNMDIIIRNYIPVKKDNVVGLYDTVEQKFYTNQGTGSFIAGPNV